MRDASGRQLSDSEERRVRMLDGVVQAAEQAKVRALHGDGAAVLVDLIANIVILVVEEVKTSDGL